MTVTLIFARKTRAVEPVENAQVRQFIEFATKRSAIQVAEAFRVGMDLPIGVDSPMFGQLYIASITVDGIDFISSSNRGRAFASRLEIVAVKRGGSSGSYRVVEVNEKIASVADLHQLYVVERRVRAVLDGLGAQIGDTSIGDTSVADTKFAATNTSETRLTGGDS
jgi:hypothetical protein